MGYSLRTRSASKSEIEAPKKNVANMPKPAVKKVEKKAEPKKTVAIKKVEVEKKAEPKKIAETNKAPECKRAAPVKAVAKKVAPVKAVAKKAAPVKAEVKKEVKKAAPAKASPAKKATLKALSVKKAPAKATPVQSAVKKTATPKKAAVRKVSAPVVKIEEVEVPEIEPILHEEPEEKVIEFVEEQIVSTHIRFCDDGTTENIEIKDKSESTKEFEDGEIVEILSDASIKSNDFEALDEIKDEQNNFELYNSESETEEEIIEEVKRESPILNAHSAFEAFTSQEEPKKFNWGNSGSTYYKKLVEENPAAGSSVKPSEPVESAMSVESPAPTVISNPFGFGFTATTISVTSAPAQVATARPNPFSFNSHFQSVSSPLDKLCTLTSNSNPVQVISNGFSFGSSSFGTSSFLPTSPAAGFSKVARSPSDHGEEREERSPSVIQSIIIDDKHEDFSAF